VRQDDLVEHLWDGRRRRQNTAFFVDGIYGYDKFLDGALKKGYPYPTAEGQEEAAEVCG
jgi:hypothetical protein